VTVPTFQSYPDRGCKLAPKCLECPLPVCKEDMASNGRRGLAVVKADIRDERDAAIREQRKNEGSTAKELAAEFELTERTIYRILWVGQMDLRSEYELSS